MGKNVARLYSLFQPSNYHLTIEPDRNALHFRGQVIIHGKKTGRPSQRITLHQHDLVINSASIVRHDKKGDQEFEVHRVNIQKSFQEVRLHTEHMLYPGEYTITIDFEAPITRGMTGLYPCFFSKDGKDEIILATQFESHHAREVFPCIDEPEAKATFDLQLVVEPGITALGNTPIASRVTNEDGQETVQFETSPKMSSYLLAFVIGDIHKITGKTQRGTEVSIWGTSAQPKESFAFALDAAIRSIEFFEDYFKTPYPLPKADHVALPDFSSGAMENWGLITYREAVLLLYPDAISQSSKETIATVIAHETSHQWFGNLVTMRWWNDLWLNESFANMMEYLAVDAMYPDWDIWESFVTVEGLSALRRDATPGVQAVKTTVHHPDEISTLFDPSIVYAKGGRLLYMLKNYIGDDAFRKGLQEYFKTHAYSNTEGKDLWTALSQSSGKDIAGFMNPWLERSGFPVVTVDQQDDSLTLTQAHFLDDKSHADPKRLWPVPLFADRGDVPELLDAKAQSMTLTDSLPVVLNRQNRAHFITRYEQPKHREFLATQVKEGTLSNIDRLTLLADNTMLARAGYQPYSDTLRLLEAYSREQKEPVWDIMTLVIADTKRFVDLDESLEPKLKSLVAKLIQQEYERLGWQETDQDSAADEKLRATILGLGVYAEVPEITEKALAYFKAFQSDQQAVSAELRGVIFSAAVKHKTEGAVDYLLELHHRTNSSDLQRDIAGGLTATKDPVVAAQLLELVKNPDFIKPQDADHWLIYLLRNRYTRETAWNWMEENWAWIIKTYKNDKSYDNFPRYAAMVCANREWETRYKEFFEPKMHETALARNITIGIAEIASRIAWLERDITDVQAYFTAR